MREGVEERRRGKEGGKGSNMREERTDGVREGVEERRRGKEGGKGSNMREERTE